ncbi:MAG: mannose-1-phosphate guanylyltransferase/mannose-6-phosphate isomerase [Halothiobacillus sp.]
MSSTLVPVILCGGAGARLWPLSREQHPKPFIRMPDGQSLLQKVFIRAQEFPDVQQLIIVTNKELLFKTEDDLREINATEMPASYILEPFGRNTAAAVTSAALLLAEQNPEALMLVLAADHLIENSDAFIAAVARAKSLALQNKLVTFGISPTEPETGYGYIEHTGETVIRFVEKPTRTDAEVYVESGRFLWNSGMFCFKAQAFIDEMAIHAPHILQAVRDTLLHSKTNRTASSFQCDLDANLFGQVPEDSIDYALMERTHSAAVVPCDIGWSDIGSWRSMSQISPADQQGNTFIGEVYAHDVSQCYIRAENRLIGAVGLENIIIVDTPDALLVAHKDRTQEVKQIYTSLKKKDHESHRLHQTVNRPWGTYTVLEVGDGFKMKRIMVKPGASLSLQMHYHRSEHWIVVSGSAIIVNGEEEIFLTTNQSTYIPAGHTHRLTNPGKIDLTLIEVQTGQYLGEDDIVRFEDVYGRVETQSPSV